MRKNGLAQAQKDLQHSRFDMTLLYCLSDTSFLDNTEKMNKRIDGLFDALEAIEARLLKLCEHLCMPE